MALVSLLVAVAACSSTDKPTKPSIEDLVLDPKVFEVSPAACGELLSNSVEFTSFTTCAVAYPDVEMNQSQEWILSRVELADISVDDAVCGITLDSRLSCTFFGDALDGTPRFVIASFVPLDLREPENGSRLELALGEGALDPDEYRELADSWLELTT
ncbi:hypothetical protein [Demequina sp.]|uniref:hypothetical protein n=1 Tax=Demequina sp. TaxID=2050685 RepID=UPI0025C7237D|nr:hypothetical protein [Demequina sp.]